jgi:hypothetical protein
MRLCSNKCQLRDECSGNSAVAAREESKLSPPVTDIRSIDACYGGSHRDIPMPSKRIAACTGMAQSAALPTVPAMLQEYYSNRWHKLVVMSFVDKSELYLDRPESLWYPWIEMLKASFQNPVVYSVT